ncbi:MAG: hypothetical protein AMJ95_07135 [Omnitrophica WOR_2 bacterium SM23_72]|nr:MAG: hypothetical protein AMJ95_07135 [Omnitrophica WOR_2 bacterium SM23_72]
MSFKRNAIDAKALQISVVLFISVFLLAGAIAYLSLRLRSSYEKINKENVDIKKNFATIKAELAKLKSDNKALSQDRDNLLIQTKKLITDKNLATELKASLDESKKLIEQLEKDKAEALAEGLSLQEEREALEAMQERLYLENEQLKKSLEEEKLKSSAAAWQQEKKELEEENRNLKNELKQVQAHSTRADKALEKSERDLGRSQKEAAELKKKLEKLQKDYASLREKNKTLQRSYLEAPGKFAELARQNQALIKQTANMHYNLGVFYTKNKQYSRAIAEFEKAVELNPQDAHAHFNLGYIYAQYVENRSRAVEHFRKYINYADKNDKDMNWVKSYILTWSSYEGKEALD